MWERILLCLPKYFSSQEIGFHREKVLRAYRQIVDGFYATGYRDRDELKATRSRLTYSMEVLRHEDRSTFDRMTFLYWRMLNLDHGFFEHPEAVVSKP